MTTGSRSVLLALGDMSAVSNESELTSGDVGAVSNEFDLEPEVRLADGKPVEGLCKIWLLVRA